MARTETEQLVIDLEARVAQFEKNFAKANATASKNWSAIERRGEQASRRINQHMASATAGVNSFANSLKGLAAGFVGGFGVAGLQRLVTDSLNAADAIGEVAQVTDVSTRFLQEMRYAAQLSGVETRGLDDSLRRLTRRVGLFIADGGGPAQKALERLGLASRITSGQLRGTEPIFNAVVAALQGVESQAERAALASQLFGDDFGPKLVPLLDQGTEGIAKLREEAERLGIVMSDELIAKAASANDQLDRLAFIVRTKTTIGVVEFTDAIRELVKEIAPLLEWIDRVAENWGSFGEFLTHFGVDIVENTKRELEGLKNFLKSLGADIEDVQDAASKPLEVDIRHAAGFEPAPAGTGGSAPRTIPPSPAKPSFIVGTFTNPLGDEEAERKLAGLQRDRLEITKDTTKATNELTAAQIAAANAGQQFALTVSQGLTQAITGATSFKDAVTGIIQQLAEAIIQAIIFRSITGAIGAPGTADTAGTGLLGLFAGGFATGGTIPAGRWGIVGERGAEPVFGPATVLPNKAGMTAQSVVITNTVNVNVEGGSKGPEADRDLAKQIGQEVEAVIDQRITDQLRTQMRPGNLLNPVQSSLR